MFQYFSDARTHTHERARIEQLCACLRVRSFLISSPNPASFKLLHENNKYTVRCVSVDEIYQVET